MFSFNYSRSPSMLGTKQYDIHDTSHGSVESVSVLLHDEATLEDMCQAFAQFLRGAGYVFDGEVCIVEEDE